MIFRSHEESENDEDSDSNFLEGLGPGEEATVSESLREAEPTKTQQASLPPPTILEKSLPNLQNPNPSDEKVASSPTTLTNIRCTISNCLK